jgi:elongation factor Tu
VVALNKMDVADEEIAELVQLEVEELLEQHGFEAETPFVKCSAITGLGLEELLDSCDSWIEEPPRKVDEPFLMSETKFR